MICMLLKFLFHYYKKVLIFVYNLMLNLESHYGMLINLNLLNPRVCWWGLMFITIVKINLLLALFHHMILDSHSTITK